MMLSFIIPTRDRHEELDRTLRDLARLDLPHGSEVVVVDNASAPAVRIDGCLRNGAPVRTIRSERNLGAAGRNLGAEACYNEWLVMLDDDSAPLDMGVVDAIGDAAPDVACIGAEIFLPDGAHESGGLPEVPIGCGVAIRRGVFLDVGGYDESFGYYAEEYDLAGKLFLSGLRIVHDFRFRAVHRKVSAHRDMDDILARLVRNNGWVRQRYAPENIRQAEIDHEIDRYRGIAVREHAQEGFERGVAELRATLDSQDRREMPADLYARFTGAAAARAWLGPVLRTHGCRGVAVVEPGKGVEVIEGMLAEHDVRVVPCDDADALVVGTLSPGPMLDAVERWGARSAKPVLAAWEPRRSAQ